MEEIQAQIRAKDAEMVGDGVVIVESVFRPSASEGICLHVNENSFGLSKIQPTYSKIKIWVKTYFYFCLFMWKYLYTFGPVKKNSLQRLLDTLETWTTYMTHYPSVY